jgi:hypothetical protein
MISRDIFRKKIRQFDPLDIGDWALESEFDHMWPKIESMIDLDETTFTAKATDYFIGCFADGELARSKREVESFFRELHRLLAKERAV